MCVFSLSDLISALIVIQTLLQTIAQCIALVLIRRQAHPGPNVYRMPLYPIPVIIALVGWVFIIATSEMKHIVVGVGLAVAGVCVYLVQASKVREWPFRHA